MPVVAVIGAQWGDEGKGKVVDLLSPKADIIARSQGGANAGHTIERDGQRFILHLLPSGILTPEKRCLIGPGVVLDPDAFNTEIEEVKSHGINLDHRLIVDNRTHLVFPTHKLLDNCQEEARGGNMIGTTSRGIGPAYADKSARRGVRVGDLLDDRRRQKVCSEIFDIHTRMLEKVYGQEPPDKDAFLQNCEKWAEGLRPYARNAVEELHIALDNNQTVLLEGAQGTYLDIDLGTYPFVTSSHPTVGGAVLGIGMPPGKIDFVLGVIKAYCTRVGSGPFPTEMDAETAEEIRKCGAEFGSTTGRPRRCGWLDLAAAKQSARWNGINGWAVTKLDVLDGLEHLKAGIGYQIRGSVITSSPSTRQEWDEVEPVYAGLKSWKNCASKRDINAFPKTALDYLGTIEKFTGVPVSLISVGADHEATIMPRGDII